MKNNILEIKNLSFAYLQQEVLQDINLEVVKDDFLAIIGPNGGGKSTLLKLILGLEKVKIGTIKISKNLGYVPQNTNININFPIKVIDVVLMGHKNETKVKGIKKYFKIGYTKEEKDCARASLKQVGMDKFADSKIGSLSGGQRQRVMVARALSAHPKILLLDEPTSSIDVEGQKQIYDLLKKLNKEITIIVVSHDISVILGYASKVAYINKKLVIHNSIEKDIIDRDNGHFCEVEMIQMLDQLKQKDCCC